MDAFGDGTGLRHASTSSRSADAQWLLAHAHPLPPATQAALRAVAGADVRGAALCETQSRRVRQAARLCCKLSSSSCAALMISFCSPSTNFDFISQKLAEKSFKKTIALATELKVATSGFMKYSKMYPDAPRKDNYSKAR